MEVMMWIKQKKTFIGFTHSVNRIDWLSAVKGPDKCHHKENVVEQVCRRKPVTHHSIHQKSEVHVADQLLGISNN